MGPVLLVIKEFRSLPAQQVPNIDDVRILSGEGVEVAEDGDPITFGSFEDQDPAPADGINFTIHDLSARLVSHESWSTDAA